MKLTRAEVIASFGIACTLSACGADSVTQGKPKGERSIHQVQQTLPVNPQADTVSRREQRTAHQALTENIKNLPKSSLEAFLPEGTSLLSSATGDLNGDGSVDAAIVADPGPTGNEISREKPSRIVILLVRTDGVLQEKKRNISLVPCEKCGGMAGDPFGYLKIEDSTITIVVESGSPSVHWSEEYEFDYSPELEDWTLRQVEHRVTDRIDDRSEQRRWSSAVLGEIRFGEFDRTSLPHPITLLERDQKDH